MNEPRSYTAQTVEVAVSKAARELGVPMAAVRYEVVFDGKGGLFGIGKREVEINVDVDATLTAAVSAPPTPPAPLAPPITLAAPATAPEREQAAVAPAGTREPRGPAVPRRDEGRPERSAGRQGQRTAPGRDDTRGGPRREGRGPRPPRPRSADAGPSGPERPPTLFADETPETPPLEGVTQVIRTLVEATGLNLIAEFRQDPAHIVVTLSGPDESILVEEDGEAVEGLQYLVNLMLRRAPWAPGPRVSVVCAGQRSQRDRMIEDEARLVAARVRATGQAEELLPMNAYERRVAHMALAEESGLKTFSTGEGRDRRLTIAPAD